MSSTINASTASGGGIVTTADASGILQLQTAGVTGLTIDASQNVGIGTSSPASYGGPLSIYAATNPVLTIASGNANAYLRLYSTSDGTMYLSNTGGSMTMITANTEKMRIDSTGQQSSTIVGYGTYNEYKCRAWVNFNGTGTVAIRASGNVSSITDNGVGDYTVNFTTAMPDANYSVGGSTQYNNTGAQVNQNIVFGINDGSGNIAAASARVSMKTNATPYDCTIVMVSIFR